MQRKPSGLLRAFTEYDFECVSARNDDNGSAPQTVIASAHNPETA